MVLINLTRSLLVRRSTISIALNKQIHKAFNEIVNMPVKKAVEEFEIYPDVIKSIPKDLVDISYGNLEVKLGNELTPTSVKNIPTKIDYRYTAGKYYTLCMTDPDAPSRQQPTYREWHHWLIVNIPENRISDGEVLSEYIGSGPPPNTGLHRYVFLVYEQPEKIQFNEKKLTNRSGENRGCFSISDFAAKYNLNNPIACNFYQAQYDDYVPELYKQLGEA